MRDESLSSLNVPLIEADNLENIEQDRDDAERPKTLCDIKWQIVTLSIAVLAQGYLLISCFPYIAFLCIYLVPTLNVQNAGFYAGIISSVYMIGRAFSSYGWTTVANVYGRKTVFFWSYILSIIFSAAFGLSSSIEVAIVSRFFLGASNGLVAVVKTACIDLSAGDKELESKINGFVFGMRGWGLLISPLVGGFLADPIKQFPNSRLATLYPEILAKYPYLLPNLVGTFICFVGLIAVALFIRNDEPQQPPQNSPTISFKTIWQNENTRDHLIIFWLLVFSSLAFDESVPLFLIANRGGLGLHEKTIGLILSGSGLFYGVFQYVLYYQIYSTWGLYGTMKIATTIGTPLAILTPLAAMFNRDEPPNEINWYTYLYLVILLGIIRIFAGIMFAAASLGATKAIPQDQLPTMVSLSMLGGSVAQALGPFIAGYLTSFSLSSGVFQPSQGVFLSFGLVTVVGLSTMIFTLVRVKTHYTIVE